MGYRGHDGGEYNTFEEMMAANTRYAQNEKNNRLLEEQNDLIRKQALLNAQIEEAKMNHEKEMKKLEADKEKELLEMQIAHEKEMRLVSLFDNCGLSKNTYDEFMNMMFALAPIQVDEDFSKMCENMKEELNAINKYLKDPKKNFKDVEMYILSCNEQKLEYLTAINKLKKYLNREIPTYEAREYLKDNADFKLYRKKSIMGGVLIFVISTLICFIATLDHYEDFALYFYLVAVVVSLVVGLRGTASIGHSFINDSISEYQNKVDHMDEYFNYDEEIKARKEFIESAIKTNATLDKSFKTRLKAFENVWNMFCDFRVEHYNSDIEKLLVETGIKDRIEKLGLKYTKINSANKKGEGTIEEYEIFFDSALEEIKENTNK